MPFSDEVRSLLLKYIAGETDKEESKMVEGWLANDPKMFEEFEQLWDLWYAVGTATNVFRFNVDKGWDTVLNKSREKKGNNKSGHVLGKIMIWGGSVAAAVLLLLGFILWHKSENNNPGTRQSNGTLSSVISRGEGGDTVSNTPGDMVVRTAPGKRKQVRLPDGSLAWLNGSTTIRFTTNEKDKVRKLYLSGQAFFDIKHDARKPFTVKTAHASIKVLGTRFDVTAYPGDAVTEAVLTGGSILFSTETKDKKISRHISPGQKISIDYLSGQLKVMDVDTAFYASWKEGKLLFRDETFANVAEAMGHKYNVAFEFRDKFLKGKKLNGYLEKESLQEALKALKLTLQFQYKIVGRTVIIYQ